MAEPRIEISMSVRQAEVLSEALEIVSRLHLGQLDVLTQCGAKCTLSESFDLARQLYPELQYGQHYGIRSDSIDDKSRVLWDMHQVMRHHLAWRGQSNTIEEGRKGRQIFCNFDEPYITSHTEKQLISFDER